MDKEEALEQLESLIEAWRLCEADLNQTDINAIEHIIEENKKQEKIIREAREYVENHSLYEEEYDYDFEENIYLSGVNDTTAKKDLLEILDRDVK